MRNTSLVTAALLTLGFAVAPPAFAHIDMDAPVTGRQGPDQKSATPCEGRPRSATPLTFEPGATITLGVVEKVAHDGYFRISFDDDGEDGFKDPQSIDPLNPDRYGSGKKCQGTPDDKCGKSDFCNVVSTDGGPTVLWDHLDPHLGASSGRNKKWSWTVTLPNVECDNCTLQVMQVMEDPAFGAHGPFDGEDDLYYRCVDIVLKKGAGGTTGVTTDTPNNKGVDCLKQAGGPSTGAGDASVPPPAPSDAGSKNDGGSSSSADAGVSKPPTEEPGEGDDDDDDSSTVDTRDASTAKPPRKDAGSAADHDGEGHDDDTSDEPADEDDDSTVDGDDESEGASAGADDGCSVTRPETGSRALGGLLGSVLAVGLLLARRRRRA